MTDWPPSKADIVSFFSRRAASYDQSQFHRWLAAQTIANLRLPESGVFLDLAAGTGLAIREIAARVSRESSQLIAVDLASDLLSAASTAASADFHLETIVADVETLPLDDACVDVAV